MTKTKPLIALLISALFVIQPVAAQSSIDELNSNAVTAMRQAREMGMPAGAEKWAEALGYLTEAVDTYDARAMKLFGPKFGWFWYFKGTCELKLQQYDAAQESFQTCYEKYPNTPENGGGNAYDKKSLLKWGEAAQGAEDWETAVTAYKKFLAERDQDDDFPKGAFYVNLAICYFNSGKTASGRENLDIAIRNKDVFPTPASGIMAGFQAFADSAIKAKKEADLLDFIDKNRAHLIMEPWQADPMSPVFMRLAAAALQADMTRAAFELYSFVPSTLEAEDSLLARIDSLGDYKRPIADGSKVLQKDALQQQLNALREREQKGQLPEITALAATAYIHEQSGNIHGAFAAYEILETHHSDAPRDKREQNLYHYLRTASLIGKPLLTAELGERFIKLFPSSEYVESVNSLRLSSLFFDGEYEKCLEVATTLEPKLAADAPSKQHDIALHVLGGSLFYTGQFDKAIEPLKRHPKEYPDSQFKVAARYFEASNWAALQQWTTASSLLDKFIDDYPNPKENAYLPYALYDRANCHYAEEEYDDAIKNLNRVESEFPDSSNREMVFNLKGNILQTEGKIDEAITYYKKALELAETKNNGPVAGEALFYLVGLLGEEGRGDKISEALPYYDRFWEKYGAGSPFKAQVAVAGMPALKAANRRQEGLDRLQGVIAQLAKVPGAWGLEEAINSYTKFYLEENDEEALKDHYYNFPGITSTDKAAQALLRIAIIKVFEDRAKTALKEGDEATASKANASVKVLFEDLKRDFDLPTLSNFILVSVGDYLREKTSAPKQAIPYYEEILGRSDQSYRFESLFGLADVYARSDNSSELNKAIENLETVYENTTSKKQKESALFRMIEVRAKQQNWEKTKERAKEYLAPDKRYTTFAPEVSLILGQTYENLGQKEDALAVYEGIYGAFGGYIKVSAPAMKRYMELLWARNRSATGDKKSDRQYAYDFGSKFLQQTSHIRESGRMTDEETEAWDAVQKLVQQYAANPGITTGSTDS